MHMITNFTGSRAKVSFITFWNVAGALVISLAKGQHPKFNETLQNAKRSLENIFLKDADLLVATLQVKWAEMLGTQQLMYQIINIGNWITILHCQTIDSSMINHYFEWAILLKHEEDWREKG